MAYIGNIQPFDPNTCDFKLYIERVNLYFEANEIDATKRVSVLLTLIGDRTYSVLKDLLDPDAPSTKTLKQIVDVLTEHYSPKKSVIAERFTFSRRRQGSNESMAEYIAAIKKLSVHCNFGTFLNDALRDKLIEGVSEVPLQRELLNYLTFNSASEMSLYYSPVQCPDC